MGKVVDFVKERNRRLKEKEYAELRARGWIICDPYEKEDR